MSFKPWKREKVISAEKVQDMGFAAHLVRLKYKPGDKLILREWQSAPRAGRGVLVLVRGGDEIGSSLLWMS